MKTYCLCRWIKRGPPLHAGGSPWQNKHLLIFAARGCAPCGSGYPSAVSWEPSLWSPSRSRALRGAPRTSQRMNIPVTDQVKVCAEHQQLLAFVHVQQSSTRQVRNNIESQRPHYGFAEQTAHLGWSYERIIVIDEDQGQSGALALAPGGLCLVVRDHNAFVAGHGPDLPVGREERALEQPDHHRRR